jgi:hypothetical protein
LPRPYSLKTYPLLFMSVKITNKRPPSVTKVGRKPAIRKLTPEMLEQACEALALGMPQSKVASLLQIPQSTFARMLKANTPDAVEAQVALASAKSGGIKRHLENIAFHSQKNWLCSAWILDRTCPQHFAQQTRTSSGSEPAGLLVQLVQNVTGKAKESTKQATVEI